MSAMPPRYRSGKLTLWTGDCRDVLPTLPAEGFHAIVTDPPYELGFMGKGWDASGVAYDAKVWIDCLRVLKPGGMLLAFGGTRTYHRLASAVEDAGFEIRDSIAWLYGSGFPKSLDVSKAIDKAAGAERAVTGSRMDNVGIQGGNFANASARGVIELRDTPATEAAQIWTGWGTALKPAVEPIVVARKPFPGTVAANVMEHGTGAIYVDGCRVFHDEPAGRPATGAHGRAGGIMGRTVMRTRETTSASTAGRWPSNVVLSHAPECGDSCVDGCPVAELDAPSRFFPVFRYQAKASTKERPKVDGLSHPTVKPLELMRWLVRLVTPPGGTVLDPFNGTGTTGEACRYEGFAYVGIEREAAYTALTKQRWKRKPP